MKNDTPHIFAPCRSWKIVELAWAKAKVDQNQVISISSIHSQQLAVATFFVVVSNSKQHPNCFKPITLKEETEEYTKPWGETKLKPPLLVRHTRKMFAANFNKCCLLSFHFLHSSFVFVHTDMTDGVFMPWIKISVLNVILNFIRIEFPLYAQSCRIAWQWK